MGISDKSKIANKFNEYFVKIGSNLASKIDTLHLTNF